MSPGPRTDSPGFRRRCRSAAVRALALATTATAALLFAQPGQAPSAGTPLDAQPVAVTDRPMGVTKTPMGSASWNAFAAKADGLCLDAHRAATAKGTKLVLWACNAQNNQKWSLT